MAKFWQLVYYIVGETSKYLTTLIVIPIIRISFYVRISYPFSLFSIANTIELNLVYRLYLFILNKTHLNSPYILIGLTVSISSFRSLELSTWIGLTYYRLTIDSVTNSLTDLVYYFMYIYSLIFFIDQLTHESVWQESSSPRKGKIDIYYFVTLVFVYLVITIYI